MFGDLAWAPLTFLISCQAPNDPQGKEDVIPKSLILGPSEELNRRASKLSRLAALEAELNAIVERMRRDWARSRSVSEDTAEQLHLLLKRARLL